MLRVYFRVVEYGKRIFVFLRETNKRLSGSSFLSQPLRYVCMKQNWQKVILY